MGIAPEQLAKSGTEDAHQMALFCWCNLNLKKYPELRWFHAIPNGGSRGDTAQSRAIAGGKMKAGGVKPGVPDTLLPVARGGCHGLYIELKKPSREREKNGGASDPQIEFRDFAHSQGYGWALAYSWEQARDMLVAYLEQH